MPLRVLMIPQLDVFSNEESGVKRVIEAYYSYAKEFDIQYVDKKEPYDLVAAHAGAQVGADVAINHGLYWTGDYDAQKWEWGSNRDVINVLRQALEITVPSSWVAQVFERDMRIKPHILGHGVYWDDWQERVDHLPIILWNKNRSSDVCDPTPVTVLAEKYDKLKFVTTFLPARLNGVNPYNNVRVTGLLPHHEMKQVVMSSSIYLATTKETFGIGVLEAMASGVPVLGFAHGGNLDLVQHGVNGYLARVNDYEDLCRGLEYCVAYKETLGKNGRELARQFTWQKACEKLRHVYDLAMQKKTMYRTTLDKQEYIVK